MEQDSRAQPSCAPGRGEDVEAYYRGLLIVVGSAWATQAADYPEKLVTWLYRSAGRFEWLHGEGARRRAAEDSAPAGQTEAKSGNFGIDAIQMIVGKNDGYTLMVEYYYDSMTLVMHWRR